MQEVSWNNGGRRRESAVEEESVKGSDLKPSAGPPTFTPVKSGKQASIQDLTNISQIKKINHMTYSTITQFNRLVLKD